MSQWEFSASIEDDGDLLLEWYKDKGNVVTVGFSPSRKEVLWAALIDSVSNHGCVRSQIGSLTASETACEHEWMPVKVTGDNGVIYNCKKCGGTKGWNP
jgi:hypothetical protein